MLEQPAINEIDGCTLKRRTVDVYLSWEEHRWSQQTFVFLQSKKEGDDKKVKVGDKVGVGRVIPIKQVMMMMMNIKFNF